MYAKLLCTRKIFQKNFAIKFNSYTITYIQKFNAKKIIFQKNFVSIK